METIELLHIMILAFEGETYTVIVMCGSTGI